MPIESSLAELETYTGTNPKPEDFDAFWRLRKAEAGQVVLNYRVEESDVKRFDSCHFYHLWFKGLGNETLHAKYVRPNTKDNVPIVVQFHGYPGSSRSWFEQASFAGMGFGVIAFDCPGQGGKSQDSGSYIGSTVNGHIIAGLDGDAKDMYYIKVYQNICILMRIIQDLSGIDHSRTYVNGASQGGGLATVCAALHPGIVKKGVILYPFLSDFQRVCALGKDEEAYEGLRYYMRYFDPMGERKQEIFTKLGYIDVHNFAPNIRSDILFGCSLADDICPLSTQLAVYNNIHSTKQIFYYHEYGHEEIPMFDDAILDFLQEDDGHGN